MKSLPTKTRLLSTVLLLLLLFWSCTAITHVDEFEVAQTEEIPPEIKTCMDQDFNLNLSDECAYCRCTTCDREIHACSLRCWEIVRCAILNGCISGDTAGCVVEKCPSLLDRQQVAVEQANALATCINKCSDDCLTL